MLAILPPFVLSTLCQITTQKSVTHGPIRCSKMTKCTWYHLIPSRQELGIWVSEKPADISSTERESN